MSRDAASMERTVPNSYDPEDVRTWPKEQRELWASAWIGLIDGNLRPLAAYLRSSYPIPRQLRDDLVACIEEDDTLYQIVTKKRRSGRGGASEKIALDETRLAIIRFVDRKIAEGSSAKAAIIDACQEFGVSPATVKSARKFGKDLKEGRAHRVSFTLRGWGAKKAR